MDELADGVFVETRYEGVNVAAILTDKGFICIDAPSYPRNARDWVAQLQQLSDQPIQYLVLTDWQAERVLNSRWLNAPIIAHQFTAQKLAEYERRYPQTLLDNLLARNPYRGRELLPGPIDGAAIRFSHEMWLCKGSHRIHLYHKPGPTAGNIWVHLPEEGILFAGDHIINDWPPSLAEAHIDPWLATLADLQEQKETLHCIVPGRGAVGNRRLVGPMLALLSRLREQVAAHLAQGRPRDELVTYIPEFIAHYQNAHWPQEWLHNQFKISLERIYNELASIDNKQREKKDAKSHK